jgi:hypothetical protein
VFVANQSFSASNDSLTVVFAEGAPREAKRREEKHGPSNSNGSGSAESKAPAPPPMSRQLAVFAFISSSSLLVSS